MDTKQIERLTYLHSIRDGQHLDECRKTEQEYISLLQIHEERLDYLQSIRDGKHLEECCKTEQEYISLLQFQ